MGNLIILLLIISFFIGISKLNRNNKLQRAQYNDFRFGSSRGYGRRTAIRDSIFNDNQFIITITIWIIRLGLIYLIFSGTLNNLF